MSSRAFVRVIAISFAGAFLFTAAATAQLVDFQGQVASAANWLVPCADCGGNISIDFATTMGGSQDKWTVQENQFTDAVFAANYGPSSHMLALRQLDQPSTLGQTTVQFDFPQPLQSGSQFVIWDLDAVGEKFYISKDTGPFSTPQQMESKSGAMSTFASWDSAAQMLARSPGVVENDKEAYVWDVSGARTVNLVYETERPAIANVSFNVVPEPNSMLLIGFSLLGFAGSRRL